MTRPMARAEAWWWVLPFTLLFLSGCHWVFGAYDVDKNADKDKGGVCTAGSERCNNEYLLSCSSDQSSWVLDKSCTTRDQCDSKVGCLVCAQADMRRCNGARAEACSANRASWDPIGVTCPSAELCSVDGACRGCSTPDAYQCTVDGETSILRKCDGGVWKQQTTCPSDGACQQVLGKIQAANGMWDGTCSTICVPDLFSCDGATLRHCAHDGASWTDFSCISPALCDKTRLDANASPDHGATLDACEPGCGAPGTPHCTDDHKTLQRCKDDQTDWETVETCSGEEQCTAAGQGSCAVCSTGTFQCNGGLLEKCDENHSWKQQADCKSAALCQVASDQLSGSCATPVCSQAGSYTCGSQTDALTPGPRLWQCSADLTKWIAGDTCDPSTRCSAADKKCQPVACQAGAKRCNLTNTSLVEQCNATQDGWDPVTTCPADQFCQDGECKTSCASALLCNGRFLETCDKDHGVLNKAECQSNELCACSLTGTCAGGVDGNGCGVPVCGAGSVCEGSKLKTCNPGRDGWTVKDCGDAALCVPGASGYCGVCKPGDRICEAGGAHTQACAPDQKSWNIESTCPLGCYTAPDNSQVYCAACLVDEHRCQGSNLTHCNATQSSLPLEQMCQFGCVDGGNNDYCLTCGKGELRCSSDRTKLQSCNADQKGLSDKMACPNGCIDNGTSDYCADCHSGDVQCNAGKTGYQTCGKDGHWGTVTACDSGCVASGNSAYCLGCAAGETRCSGQTLLTCSADQTKLGDPTTSCAAYGCVDSGIQDYCAVCATGEQRCSGATLQSCAADRSSLTKTMDCGPLGCIDSGQADYCAACAKKETRCSGDSLLTCANDQGSLGSPLACQFGCIDSGTSDYCAECRSTQTRCTADGQEQDCGTDGHWGTPKACPNGCFGGALSGVCGACTPGMDTQCTTTGSALQSCNDMGQWSTTTTACSLGCVDSGSHDYCAECSAGDSKCSGANTLQTCTNGRFVSSACDFGCVGSGGSAQCAPAGSGGMPGSGGDTSSGGATLSGGAPSGGTSNGGTSNGGTSNGGTSNGGAPSNGGAASGGAANGGTMDMAGASGG